MRSLPRIPHFCLRICISKICCFRFYIFEYSCPNRWLEQYVENATEKGKYLFIEGDDFCFISDTGSTGAGDCCGVWQLKESHIILSCIFSMLFSDFRAHGHSDPSRESIDGYFPCKYQDKLLSTASIMVFFSNSIKWYECSCTHTVLILCYADKPVSSGNRSILFKVLTLNVARFTVFLYLSKFCLALGLSSVFDFFNSGTKVPTSKVSWLGNGVN